MGNAKKSQSSYYINSAIVILLMFLVPFIPPFGQITPMGMKVLGVFVGMLWGWLTVGFVWPSLLGLIMIGFSGATTISEGLSAGWGNINLVIYTIFGFMFAAYLEACKLTDAIAAAIMTKRVFDNKPYVLVALFFVLAYVLAAAVGLFAGIFVTWAILYKVMDLCNYEHKSTKVTYLIAMVPYAAAVGMIFLPFRSGPIMYSGLVADVIGGPVGVGISYGSWMVYMFIVAVLMMLCYIAVGKYIFRFDFSLMANTEYFQYLKSDKLTFAQKFGLFDLILLIVILLSPDFLPDCAIKTVFKTLGVSGAFLLVLLLPICLKTRDGEPLADIKNCMNGVSWDVVWMLVATGPVTAAMQSADSGIVATVVAFVMHAFSGMDWIMFTIVTAAILGLVTQVTHNVIIAIVLFAPLATVCQNMGGNPIVWFMINYMINMAAFMTPAASAISALVFGNTKWVDPKYCYLYGFEWYLINLVIASLVGFTIGGVLW